MSKNAATIGAWNQRYEDSYEISFRFCCGIDSIHVFRAERFVAGDRTAPLGNVQLAIYRSFTSAYNDGSETPLNVANITEPFAPADDDRKGCLKMFPATHISVVHRFSADSFNGLKVHLVDPRLHEKRDPSDAIRKGEPVDDAVKAGFASAIFTFSEIVFNPEHNRAAFTYSFVCGGLCGNGGTVIYKLTNGKWSQEKDTCARWVS